MVKKELAIKAYLKNIRPYLRDIINDFKKLEEWKIHLEIKNELYVMKRLQ